MKIYQYEVLGRSNLNLVGVIKLATVSATRSEMDGEYFKFYLKDTLVAMFDRKLSHGFKIINVMEVTDV